jgi:hypothetical protein
MQSSLEIQPKAPEVVDSIAVPIANGTQQHDKIFKESTRCTE